MSELRIVGLPTSVEVEAGADLVTLVVDAAERAGWSFADDDVLCVASKVVAKAEAATVPLPPADDVHEARRIIARQQATRIVAETPQVLIVETHHGFVCANAGIDTSNVPGDDVALLLPHDPDASATALRDGLLERTGARIGVVVTDTFGRPWRLGQTDVALGVAGVVALRDDRGGADRLGRTLEVTQVAVADQLAAAADLVRGKADGTPFVVLRGLLFTGDGRGTDLLRPAEQDAFRVGTGPAAPEPSPDRPR